MDQAAAQEIERLIAPSVEAAGYDLVQIRFLQGNGETLQVMAERKDRRPISVQDCGEISRMISGILDVEDPFPGAYHLEVSSPGIDRPLVRLDDYIRFAGFEAKIEAGRSIAGRRRFQGRLKGVAGEAVLIDCDDRDEPKPVEIPFADIRRAMLVMTDELVAAAEDEQQMQR